jgi:hypothetical protein
MAAWTISAKGAAMEMKVKRVHRRFAVLMFLLQAAISNINT